MKQHLRLTVIALLLAGTLHAGEPGRLAVIIGIGDYTASKLPPGAKNVEPRDWQDLRGSVNDARILHELLVHAYGFGREDVVLLLDQRATRDAIVGALDGLVARTRKGDIVFFYFAGHGSRVPNSRSDEKDGFDEAIVPADSRRGAADIRDKELRKRFNAILDRGAHLTILLDHCHSGSSFRAPGGGRLRSIRPSQRDIRDGRSYGPPPEERGAVVLAAAQDIGGAYETQDPTDGSHHGAFTWALLNALRRGEPGESIDETFARARALVRFELPFQDPILAALPPKRERPFLRPNAVRRVVAPPIAIESIRNDGTIVVQGGWAQALSVGTELRVIGAAGARIRITRLAGVTRSEAKPVTRAAAAFQPGALLEIVAWAAPPQRPLRVFADHPAASRLAGDGVVLVDRDDADVVLIRRSKPATQYAWESRRGDLPARTRWTADVPTLRRDLRTLRRLFGWHTLEAPVASAYRLTLRHRKSGGIVRDARLRGGDTYEIVLRATTPNPPPRYYYAFIVDREGRSYLAYPSLAASVENRHPAGTVSATIALGADSAFTVQPPYGSDTFFLLGTDEPLPNPGVLQWDGVRTPQSSQPLSDLERLILASLDPARSRPPRIGSRWSLEKVTLESLAP